MLRVCIHVERACRSYLQESMHFFQIIFSGLTDLFQQHFRGGAVALKTCMGHRNADRKYRVQRKSGKKRQTITRIPRMSASLFFF
jgi:hypothetical protein